MKWVSFQRQSRTGVQYKLLPLWSLCLKPYASQNVNLAICKDLFLGITVSLCTFSLLLSISTIFQFNGLVRKTLCVWSRLIAIQVVLPRHHASNSLSHPRLHTQVQEMIWDSVRWVKDDTIGTLIREARPDWRTEEECVQFALVSSNRINTLCVPNIN